MKLVRLPKNICDDEIYIDPAQVEEIELSPGIGCYVYLVGQTTPIELPVSPAEAAEAINGLKEADSPKAESAPKKTPDAKKREHVHLIGKMYESNVKGIDRFEVSYDYDGVYLDALSIKGIQDAMPYIRIEHVFDGPRTEKEVLDYIEEQNAKALKEKEAK
jgi:hypothetical protein